MSTPLLQSAIRTCHRCALRGDCQAPVPGYGNLSAPIWIIGDSPGEWEDRYNRPFVGVVGKEMMNYMAVNAGISSADCYMTKLVKCRPLNGRPPNAHEIAVCSQWLERELEHCAADIVVTLGSATARWFDDTLRLDYEHGIPRKWQIAGREVTWLPCYHPAAAMHDDGHVSMGDLQFDFRQLRLLREGRWPVVQDKFAGLEQYGE